MSFSQPPTNVEQHNGPSSINTPSAPAPQRPPQPIAISSAQQQTAERSWDQSSNTSPFQQSYGAPTSMANGTAPSFPGYSASTEEILKRVSANASARAGTPSWEAAREQVLKSMFTSASIPTPPSTNSGSKRGRGRGRGRAAAIANTRADGATSTDANTVFTSSPMSWRGRGSGRGRGRGGGRGGKRKQDNSADEEDDSDISSSYTPLPTKTKSGRNINKPSQFTPAMPSPSSVPKKRKAGRRDVESSVCKVCLRGHSPDSNKIVFCDSCNTPYHQYCHDPVIDKEVVMVAEKEWLCAVCQTIRNNAFQDVQGLVSGEALTSAEKRAHFSSLPQTRLVKLLLFATAIHPSLPLFPPDLQAQDTSATNEDGADTSMMPTPPVTQPPTGQTSTQRVASDKNTADDGQSGTVQVQAMPPAPSQSASSLPGQGTTVTGPATHAAQSAMPLVLAPAPDTDAAPDTYEEYDSDPPEQFPKPGTGIARTLRPESEDLQWLVDDNFEVFSHTYRTGDGDDDGAGETDASGAEGTSAMAIHTMETGRGS